MQTENRRPCKSWTLTQSSLKALNIISLQVDDHWLDPLWFLVALQWSSRGPGSFFIHISLLVQHSVCGFAGSVKCVKTEEAANAGREVGGDAESPAPVPRHAFIHIHYSGIQNHSVKSELLGRFSAAPRLLAT